MLITAAYCFASLAAFILFAFDKRAAQRGRWRIPESTLHAVELLGGWPGALAAMKFLRHKSAKRMYQVITILIILLHIGAWVAIFALT